MALIPFTLSVVSGEVVNRPDTAGLGTESTITGVILRETIPQGADGTNLSGEIKVRPTNTTAVVNFNIPAAAITSVNGNAGGTTVIIPASSFVAGTLQPGDTLTINGVTRTINASRTVAGGNVELTVTAPFGFQVVAGLSVTGTFTPTAAPADYSGIVLSNGPKGGFSQRLSLPTTATLTSASLNVEAVLTE